MQSSDVVNIYGHLSQQSVIIAAGNFNNISGVLTHQPEDFIQIRSLPEVMNPSILELLINYETSVIQPHKLYFSLQVINRNFYSKSDLPSPQYINVNIEPKGDKKIAVANISSEKAIFSLDYSIIDKSYRPHLMAGVLYSLETVLGEQTYIVSWNIQGFDHGDLIIFLPTTWYEGEDCMPYSGINTLMDRLNQLQFRGYTTSKWCHKTPNMINCTNQEYCGPCLGQCPDSNQICYPDNSNFVCGSVQSLPDMETDEDTTSTEELSSTGTYATWIALFLIFLIVLILAWGLNTQIKIE